MKYKLKISMEGPETSLNVGDEVELNDWQAKAYAEAGYIDIEPSKIEKIEKPKKSQRKADLRK
ncbi:MAG: hypothetical protein JKY53_14875 [Flavobacteriales bacterium]|nr:hypothetical protein [Flavobacteriales bacterium]